MSEDVNSRDRAGGCRPGAVGGVDGVGTATVEVGGELDASNAGALVRRLLDRGAGVTTLTVDLRAVSFLDCAAVGALATVAARRRALWRCTVLVVTVGSPADRVLTLTGAAGLADGVQRLRPAPVPAFG